MYYTYMYIYISLYIEKPNQGRKSWQLFKDSRTLKNQPSSNGRLVVPQRVPKLPHCVKRETVVSYVKCM